MFSLHTNAVASRDCFSYSLNVGTFTDTLIYQILEVCLINIPFTSFVVGKSISEKFFFRGQIKRLCGCHGEEMLMWSFLAIKGFDGWHLNLQSQVFYRCLQSERPADSLNTMMCLGMWLDVLSSIYHV